MFTVIWSILDRSGNWAASAFKSTGWSACMVGGRSWPSINFQSSASTYGSHCISSICYVFSISLLLIYIVVHLMQKNTIHLNYLFHQFFPLTTIFTPSFYQDVHTQTPRHSTGLCIIYSTLVYSWCMLYYVCIAFVQASILTGYQLHFLEICSFINF